MSSSQYQGPFRQKKNIVLASASPRRQKLLSDLGLYFEVLACTIREPNPEPNEQTREYAERLAEFKAGAINRNKANTVVVAADTLISFRNQILGKPRDEQNALETLEELVGKTHQVITGCFLQDLSNLASSKFSIETSVKMARYSRSTLLAYVRSREPFDKAGSYALQGAGSFLVESIEGSYSNVVGLPLKETLDSLTELDAIYSPAPEQLNCC